MGDIYIAPMSREGAESEDSRGIAVMEHKSKKLEGRVEVGEQLLPGIPNEITLNLVCPKLPWTTFHDLSSVSHGWQQAIQSRQVLNARLRSESTQTLVVMRVEPLKNYGALVLFSSSTGSYCHLPPIPGFRQGLPYGCQCSSVDGRLYVLGGYEDSSSDIDDCLDHPSAKTYVLDLVGKRLWKQCASMGEPRGQFGCSASNGKIYVFGGTSSGLKPIYCGCEVYDPESDAWCPIAPMKSLGLFQQVVAMGEELVVHSELFNSDFSMPSPIEGLNPLNPIEVYNPLKNEWRSMERSIRVDDDVLLTVGGKLFVLSQSMHAYDVSTNSWEPFQPFSFDVLGARDSFMVKVVKAVAVDDEMLGIALWVNRNVPPLCPGERGACLMYSQGFGCQNQEIEWQKMRCSLSCDQLESMFLCPIQL